MTMSALLKESEVMIQVEVFQNLEQQVYVDMLQYRGKIMGEKKGFKYYRLY